MKAPIHQSTADDVSVFLNALRAFADMPTSDQCRMFRDIRRNSNSPRRIMQVRQLLADAIDGAADEEIVEALILGE